MSAKNWLLDNGFERFIDLFEENEIDADVLFDLSGADLAELGLPLGTRKKILKALAGEKASHVTTVTPTGPERRHLTILFADLVSSTDLSAGLDPEDMREVILAFQNAVAGEISRMNGHVARFMGDGVLAYFGYPMANEDDVARALRTGLAIAEAVGAQTAPGGRTLSVRVGIATGLVVVGDLIGHGMTEERAVVGDTPNLAARLQALASPGQVVIAPETQRLAKGDFDLTDMGMHDLKGIREPVNAWSVQGIRDHQSRFEARRAANWTPLIGRDPELALIMERWHQAREGEGQMFVVTGEAGIGKSRIIQAAVEAMAVDKPVRIGYQCSPYHRDFAFYPIIQHLLHAAGIQTRDTVGEKLDKIEAILAEGDQEAALLADLMEIDGSNRYAPLEISPARKRVQFMQLLHEILLRIARQHPVLILLEDMHWIDASSLELIERALDPFSLERVFVIATTRPVFEHGFGGHPSVTKLTLNRLGRAQVEEIAERITGGAKLPAELLEIIAARTDGVPLYVEELTKTVLETGLLKEVDGRMELTGVLETLAIPSSLHDSLMARLDRLQPIKEVAQMAACIGRTFDFHSLSALTDMPEDRLQEALDGLVKAELIFRRGIATDAVYTFKHALVRDAAYESLLRSRRAELHKRMLAALEAAGEAEPPHLKAHHAEAAGETEKAIKYWQQSGEAAYSRPAWKEAINHVRTALRLVEPLTTEIHWRHTKMELLLRLGVAYSATRSFTHPKTVETFNAARLLAAEFGNSPHSILALNLSWVSLTCSGNNKDAMETAKEAISVEGNSNDPVVSVIANRMMGASCMLMGQLEEGCRYLGKSTELFEPKESGNLLETAGIYARADLAMGLWCLGYPDQSIQHVRQLKPQSEKLKIPFATIVVLCLGVIATQMSRRRDERALIREQLSAMIQEPEMVIWKPYLDLDSALEDAANGNAEGLDLAGRKIDAILGNNHKIYLPIHISEFASVLSLHGRHEQARQRLEQALDLIEKNNERFYEAEVYRVKGDVLLAEADNNVADAENAYNRSLNIARTQQAKSLELRTATSLARLWQSQDRHEEALGVLQPVHDWFTEGFDFPDQLAAKALMNELSAHV